MKIAETWNFCVVGLGAAAPDCTAVPMKSLRIAVAMAVDDEHKSTHCKHANTKCIGVTATPINEPISVEIRSDFGLGSRGL